MLLLTQNIGDSIYVFNEDGEKILHITYIEKHGTIVRLGFEANKDLTILRSKIMMGKTLEEITAMTKKKRKNNKTVDGNIRKTDEPIFFMEENQEDNYDY